MVHSQETDICNMKAKFMEWVDSNLKHISSLLTKEQYDDIRIFLKANDKFRFDKNLSNLCIPLCIPAKSKQEKVMTR